MVRLSSFHWGYATRTRLQVWWKSNEGIFWRGLMSCSSGLARQYSERTRATHMSLQQKLNQDFFQTWLPEVRWLNKQPHCPVFEVWAPNLGATNAEMGNQWVHSNFKKKLVYYLFRCLIFGTKVWKNLGINVQLPGCKKIWGAISLPILSQIIFSTSR